MGSDDRTREEQGLIKPFKEHKQYIPKSRYDSVSSYLSADSEKYNDINLVTNNTLYETMRDNGVDHLLAQHYAHIFVKDPLFVYEGDLLLRDAVSQKTHFWNIQGSVWQTMRLKMPELNTDLGWRVEFRPTEVQLTDFENAALTSFIILMSRLILEEKIDLLIPISKVDENIEASYKRNSILGETFNFRKEILKSNTDSSICSEYTKMSMSEIMNGKSDGFAGLIPLIHSHLDEMGPCDGDTKKKISQYLTLLGKKASGELMTTARFIREFVLQHPEYKQDSVVTQKINYDLMEMCDAISTGKTKSKELLGNLG
jgi:glutamate--cysteine ligase catalytic subunit